MIDYHRSLLKINPDLETKHKLHDFKKQRDMSLFVDNSVSEHECK